MHYFSYTAYLVFNCKTVKFACIYAIGTCFSTIMYAILLIHDIAVPLPEISVERTSGI